MICGNCNAANDDNNIYCNSCGHPIANNPTFSAQPTISYQPHPPTIPVVDQQYQSVVTPFIGQPSEPPKKRGLMGLLIALIATLVLGMVAVAGLFLAMSYGGETEKLPDHLGMFVQSDAKDRVDEIRRQDFANATDARNNLMKSDYSIVASRPNFILYSDGRDVPVNDMRLVQLDTIKDDGSMKTLDFQVAPVEGKLEMKRIRMPQDIASGRYAFALFDGYFNEGKHKFWPFQVRDSSRTNNDDLLKATAVSLKPKTVLPAATKTISPPANVATAVSPPEGGTAATVKTRIKLRSGPTQFAKNQIGSLNPGQRVYILDYSTTVETFNGVTSRYAYVQTEGGKRGWAFAAFLQ